MVAALTGLMREFERVSLLLPSGARTIAGERVVRAPTETQHHTPPQHRRLK